MKIKQYQAASMYEAVQQIKSELGPDALILHAKQTKQRRFGLLPGGAIWEVLAAVDGHPAPPPVSRPDRPPASSSAPMAPAIPVNGWQELSNTLAELNWEVRKLARQSQLARVSGFAPSLRSLYQQLREQEVDEDLICDIVTSVGEELSPQALNNYSLVVDCAAKHLQRLVSCTGPLRLAAGSAKTVFIIGPTGVGKTTTIAKLAAHFALIARRRVLLATIDTYRIAALPQLKTYAEIMGLPMEVAYTPAELQNVLQENQDKDLILIDTPGRGQRNERQITELKSFIDAVQNKTVYLAISASTRYKELVDVVEKFGTIQFNSLIVTKVDEALVYGPILNMVNRFKKPLSYITTGQSVPEDIEDASAPGMANLLLGRASNYADGPGYRLKKSS